MRRHGARRDVESRVGVSSPAILYMLGIISSRPWEAVKVVAERPACRAPCRRAGRAALALHFHYRGMVPQMLVLPSDDHWSPIHPWGTTV